MKYANLTRPSRKLCFVMALAAGMTAFPLPTMAAPGVQATQQSGTVKGQVTDKSGEPIIGATVKVKNEANVGTVTNFDGYFELKNVPAGGTLIVNPVPEEYSMDKEKIDAVIEAAVEKAKALGVKGKNITPFLLAEIKDVTGGDSLETNIALVYNNVRLAARIARSM